MEDGYKIYAESFRGAEHRARVLAEAQAIVSALFAVVSVELTPGLAIPIQPVNT